MRTSPSSSLASSSSTHSTHVFTLIGLWARFVNKKNATFVETQKEWQSNKKMHISILTIVSNRIKYTFYKKSVQITPKAEFYQCISLSFFKLIFSASLFLNILLAYLIAKELFCTKCHQCRGTYSTSPAFDVENVRNEYFIYLVWSRIQRKITGPSCPRIILSIPIF